MKKQFLRKLLVALAMPLLVLLLAELGVRGIGAGFPNDLLVPVNVEGRLMWAGNPFFAYRFFIPPLARTPSTILVEREKPANLLRVVVLGESAAQGDPVPAFGPARMLNVLLQRRYPGRPVEVVNAAVTAVSSPIIRDVAGELKKLKPDVVILYVGNNEVIGPYGPVTRISRFVRGDFMQRAAVLLTRLRLSQLASQGLAMLAETRGEVRFQGVARALHHPVPFDDPRLESMRRQYERNMRAIIAKAREAGAQVLLCTAAANHTDCPPALSMHRAGLGMADRQAWERHYEQGVKVFQSGNWAAALAQFDTAAASDDGYAELVYRQAVCLQQLGRPAEAAETFARALDLDAFRYRVDSRLNEVIRTLGASLTGAVELVDVARAFRNSGVSRDAEWFVDHVHFSFEGTYALTKLWAEALARLPPFRDVQPAPGEWPALEDVKAEMLFTPVAELSFVSALLGRYGQPPFNQQFDVAARIAAYTRRLEDLTRQIQAMDVDRADALFAAHVAKYPGDSAAPYLWGQFLLSCNRYRSVVETLAPAVQRQPHRRDLRGLLARALASLGRADEAADELVGWTRKHGFLGAQAAVSHMTELVQNGQEDEALAYGRAVIRRMRPVDYRWRVSREVNGLQELKVRRDEALTLMRRGNLEAAAGLWSDLMRRRPDWPIAPYWLAVIHGLRGKPADGIPLIQQALNQWGYARASYHLGLWENRFGNPEQAQQRLREAARAAGDDEALAKSLAQILDEPDDGRGSSEPMNRF